MMRQKLLTLQNGLVPFLVAINATLMCSLEVPATRGGGEVLDEGVFNTDFTIIFLNDLCRSIHQSHTFMQHSRIGHLLVPGSL